MLSLPEHITLLQRWQRAAELMLTAPAEVEVIARQLHLALLLDCVLDTTKTEVPKR